MVFLKDAEKSTMKRRGKLPKVGLVMSRPIFSFTILPGACSAKTKEMMTYVWHMRSTVAFNIGVKGEGGFREFHVWGLGPGGVIMSFIKMRDCGKN